MNRACLQVAVQAQTQGLQLLICPSDRRFKVHIPIGFHSFDCGLQSRLKQRAIKRRVNKNQIHARGAKLLQASHTIGTQHMHIGGLEAIDLGAQLRHQSGVELAHLYMGCAT